jgi:acyl carrier protein
MSNDLNGKSRNGHNANGGCLDHQAIGAVVLASLQEVVAMGDGAETHSNGFGMDTHLIGRGSVLDSMGLVTLIVDIEQRLEEECDAVLVLADDRAMSMKKSPFRSVQALTDYVYELMQEQN